jgi:hypothetical protein
VSRSRFAFPEILLACFANAWVMLFPEILYATHPDLDVLVTSWASDFAVVDGQVWMCTFGGFLKVTGTRSGLFCGCLMTYNHIDVPQFLCVRHNLINRV